MADDPQTPFTWGADGARLTPEDIAQRRKDAATLMQQGTDATFAPGTRGAGVWTQGLAHVAKALVGGMYAHDADTASKANDADNKTMIAALLGQGSAPAAAVAAPVAAVAAPGSSASLDPETTGYIKNAADKFGVDPAYLQRTALIESGGKADATNPSGAAGLFQFMPKTAKEYGLDNPLDPEDSAMAAAELAADNRKSLADSLGRSPTNAELYLAHQQGAGGAAALLANPNVPAVQLLGRAAVLNNGGAESMTGGQFANMWLGKYGPDGPGAAQVVQGNVPPAIPQAVARVAGAMPAVPGQAPAPAAVARVAGAMPSDDATALPAGATPTQGYAIPGQPAPVAAAAAPAVAKVASALPGVNPAVLQAATSPYASPATKQIAGIMLASQLGKEKKDTFSPVTDADGNQIDVNNTTHERKMVIKASEDPSSVREYEYYKKNAPDGQAPMDYATWTNAKARAGATNVTTNIDPKAGETYDSQLASGLGKSHAALANGVEDAQARARDVAAMQGAVDAIQKNGGTTGGLAPNQRLELQKSINAGAAALGIEKPFDEGDLSDKEFLTKFNRSMAGAQAKNAVGSRVTNFEMSNYLKANPGLDMSVTGNQRLLGIQGQIEQRNIAVGNAIRDATAQSISTGKHIDPVTVQKIITDYDGSHHVQDPVTGQDLTQSYALPEFQQGGSNPALAAGHNANVGKMRRYNPATGAIE